MAESSSTAIAEAAKATSTANPPVQDSQITIMESDRAEVMGDRMVKAFGSSPEASPSSFAEALGQLPGASARGGMLRQLQRSYGNQYVGRVIQAKITVGQPGDVHEQEANRVADAVMRKAEPGVSPVISVSRQIQPRQIQPMCTECQKDEELKIHPKESPGQSSTETPTFEARLNVTRGRGQPLSKETRTFMESRFGYDLDQVRVHADAEAVQMNQELGAQAFTYGADIYFNHGKYDPESSSGKHLLAHELTHTIQQGAVSQPMKLLPIKEEEEEKEKQVRTGAETFPISNAAIGSVFAIFMQPIVPQIQLRANVAFAPSNLSCILMDTMGVPGELSVMFNQDVSTLSGANLSLIENYVGSWVGRGLSPDLIVSGYASKEGSQLHNWRLSCERAEVVHAELVRLGVPDGKITAFAHGETEDFDATNLEPNRRATIESTPGIGPIINPVLTPSDNFAGRSTNRFGLSERIGLNYSASPHIRAAEHFGVQWVVVTGTGTAINGPFPNYVAGHTPATEQVALEVSGGPAIGTRLMVADIPIIAPALSYMVQVPGTGLCHTTGRASVGFRGNMFMLPTDVSFNNVRFREGNGTMLASGSLGHYNGAVHPTTPVWAGIGNGNITTGCQVGGVDTADIGTSVSSWSLFGGTDWFGFFVWPIQWQYQATGGSIVTYMTAYQIASIDRVGRASISKAGAGPFTTGLSDPTSCIGAVLGLAPHCC